MLSIVQSRSFARWEQSLRDPTLKHEIAAKVARLSHGLPGDTKHLGDHLYELRIHRGPGYRIYYTVRGGALILLLCGGDKSSQSRDIVLARQLKRDGEQHD